tara:strand:- start:169 stop:369 length:201 start_codon:yes stop_codon:yes gene_type:complete
LLKIEFLNIKLMTKKYISELLKMFPDISSGRKNFKYFEKRVKENLEITRKYKKKIQKVDNKYKYNM